MSDFDEIKIAAHLNIREIFAVLESLPENHELIPYFKIKADLLLDICRPSHTRKEES